jgi:hypothetical protein
MMRPAPKRIDSYVQAHAPPGRIAEYGEEDIEQPAE